MKKLGKIEEQWIIRGQQRVNELKAALAMAERDLECHKHGLNPALAGFTFQQLSDELDARKSKANP